MCIRDRLRIDTFDGIGNPWSMTFSYPSRLELILLIASGTTGEIKIKKADQVLVITGKDQGKKGEVIRVNTSSNTVVVEGINIFKKHIKNTPNVTQAGIVDTELPINISNVMYIDPENSNIGRVTFEKLDSGKYNRIVKKSKRN